MVRYIWPIFVVASIAVALMLLLRWGSATSVITPEHGLQSTASTEIAIVPIRIGLIPERDIFEQRHRYRPLAEYLAIRMERPVELITVKSYPIVLEDMASGALDAAFMGSLTASMAMDRLGAQVIANPIIENEITTYQGVLFTRADRDIKSIANLIGQPIAMVRGTTAGALFPISQFIDAGVWASIPARPQIVWVGTHDEVVSQVMAGQVAAGAAKNLRYDAIRAAYPEVPLRELGRSRAVPNNALLVRADFPPDVLDEITTTLLAMHTDPLGQQVLDRFGATQFRACNAIEYEPVYDMVDHLGVWWKTPFFEGDPPQRPWIKTLNEEGR